MPWLQRFIPAFILLAVFGGILLFLDIQQKQSEKIVISPSPVTASNAVAAKLLTGMSLTVPGTDFKLTISSQTGKTVDFGDFENNPEAGYGSVTILSEYVVELDTNHYATILAINSGGSGEMFYLAYFESAEKGFQMIDAKQLADRIQMEKLTIENKRIIVDYMDHGPDQAMVDRPNVPVQKMFTYNDVQLNEVGR